ncbi:MAG: putative aconitase [Pseudorhodobacter sp.]|jgi:predicted aconitase
MDLTLTQTEHALLNGAGSGAQKMAMEVLAAFSQAIGARALIEISGAHVDGCLYHGQSTQDFVDALLQGGGRVAVPTTLNVGSMDLIHPEIMTLPRAEQSAGARLMHSHQELGCIPTFTCAPYQTIFRPRFGDQIAWGESNAIVFANSVIGARTNRYGDFMDLCCAIAGRAPAYGLHLDENRHGEIHFRLRNFPTSLAPTDALYVAIGLIIGHASADCIPVIEGLPPPLNEDQLKALGAAAASAGAVGMFHAIGITPEADTVAVAFAGRIALQVIDIYPADVQRVLAQLSTVPDGTPLTAICLGTPHFSQQEWDLLLPLLHHYQPRATVPIYVNTSRETLAALTAAGQMTGTEAFGLIPVVDTCTYITSIIERMDGVVMTNSGKWAHYAPGNIGVEVAFGELKDCIASAAAGRIVRGAQ